MKKTNFTLLSCSLLALLSGCSWINEKLPGPSAGQQQPIPQNQYAGELPWSVPGQQDAQEGTMSASKQSEAYRRLEFLEAAVAQLRRDYDQALPAFKQMITTNQRISQMLDQMQGNTGPVSSIQNRQNMQNQPMQDVIRSAVAKMQMEQQKTAAQPVPLSAVTPAVNTAQPLSVMNLRTGEHRGKTRLVLDLNKPGQFQYDIDNNEKLLVVQLPGAKWNAKTAGQIRRSPFVSAYSAQSLPGGGTVLVIQLKKQARVSDAKALKPNPQFGHRIYLDIAAL